jgi:hypothetical protein
MGFLNIFRENQADLMMHEPWALKTEHQCDRNNFVTSTALKMVIRTVFPVFCRGWISAFPREIHFPLHAAPTRRIRRIHSTPAGHKLFSRTFGLSENPVVSQFRNSSPLRSFDLSADIFTKMVSADFSSALPEKSSPSKVRNLSVRAVRLYTTHLSATWILRSVAREMLNYTRISNKNPRCRKK